MRDDKGFLSYKTYVYNFFNSSNFFNFTQVEPAKLESIIEALGIDAVMTDSAKSPEQIHSLDGCRLQRIPEKGVYIVNGRKVVRK